MCQLSPLFCLLTIHIYTWYYIHMSDNQPNQNPDEGSKPRMIQKAIYFEPNLWERAKTKAGLTPLAAIIRRLVELWLEGKIKLDD